MIQSAYYRLTARFRSSDCIVSFLAQGREGLQSGRYNNIQPPTKEFTLLLKSLTFLASAGKKPMSYAIPVVSALSVSDVRSEFLKSLLMNGWINNQIIKRNE